jgi:NAD(P)-dependent dehydrogenase (short-subunit alcohol dehydrogenase family)
MQTKRNAGWTLVTGATAGIGKALVARLLVEGRDVIAAAREPHRVDVSAGSGRVKAVRLDLTEPTTIVEAAREIAQLTADNGLSGLVNMAGVIVEGPLEAIPPEELRRQFEINVIGPCALTQSLLPLLMRTRGTIVNIGALSAYLAPPFYGPIAASKAALSSLNDAMRLEFAPYGVRVVLVQPGAMKTGIFATAKAARETMLARVPEVAARYRPALAAMERAFERSGADDPEVVVTAILAALSGRSRPVIVVGKGSGAFMLLSRFPIRLRDRLLRSALGLSVALAPLS